MGTTNQSVTWMPLVTVIVTAIFTLSGVALGSYLTSRFTYQNQLDLTARQNRQQSYSAIMGKKILLTQFFVSRFEALVHFETHQHRWRLAGYPATSLDLEEAKRWLHKAEDLALELARIRQSLYESIGMARASFPATQELEQLSEMVYQVNAPEMKPSPVDGDRAAIDAWGVNAVNDLQMFVDREYGKPIDSLLQYLKQHMNDPVS